MLLTIVTPSLNRRAVIERALDSVRTQDYPRVEHIVVDGGSTDGTLDMLRTRPDIRLIVEPDRNLYDAINKGVCAASGEVIGLLNTDDWFVPRVFGAAMAPFAADPALEVVSGGVEVVALAGPENAETVIAHQNSPAMKSLRVRDIVSGIPAINGRFLRRSVYERVGDFDCRFPVAADRDFLMRVRLAGVRNHVIGDVVYRYGSHAGSLSMAGESVRLSLAAEYLRMVRVRCRECRDDDAAQRAYRRWRAWAAGYHTAAQLRAGHVAAALGPAAGTFAEDPLWPLLFLAQIAGHWRERSSRRCTNGVPLRAG